MTPRVDAHSGGEKVYPCGATSIVEYGFQSGQYSHSVSGQQPLCYTLDEYKSDVLHSVVLGAGFGDGMYGDCDAEIEKNCLPSMHCHMLRAHYLETCRTPPPSYDGVLSCEWERQQHLEQGIDFYLTTRRGRRDSAVSVKSLVSLSLL